MTEKGVDWKVISEYVILIVAPLLIGLVLGFYAGFDMGMSMQLEGFDGVVMNETAARYCTMSVQNSTAKISCSPNINHSVVYLP